MTDTQPEAAAVSERTNGVTIQPRYPDADVLDQRGHWDETTRQVILDRVHNPPTDRFFDAHQRQTLEALCARILPQDHRPPDRRIPLAPWIEQRCALGLHDGFQFDTMPANAEAWTLVLAGLDQSAQALFGAPDFVSLTPDQQDALLARVNAGDPPGEAWQRLPARTWWVFVALRQVSGAYYAHPYAWDEIGFGGPAYPRGYFALNHGAPEPWEPREVDGPYA